MKLPFRIVDAFAARPFTGNPAAVMVLDAWLDDALLQQIAAEFNLSETAFLVPDASGQTDWELRWFTPTIEVALCGHATLASGHVLLGRGGDVVRFRTRRSGLLTVARDAEGYRLTLPAWEMVERPQPEVAALLGGPVEQSFWREGGYSLFVYPDAAAIRALRPDFNGLRAAVAGDVLQIATAPGDATDFISRVFAPGAGIDEDPVTGSAHSLLAPYWAKRLGRPRFTAHQASARGGFLSCFLHGDQVELGGSCVTVAEGMLTL